MKNQTGALLLAAGFSKRFGGSKLIAELDNTNTVVFQTYQRLHAAVPEVVVISRPELAEAISEHAIKPQIFEGADRGMGATLAFGMNHISNLNWNACMICLADMPFIRESTYRELAEAAAPDRIVVPSFEGKLGNPVIFGRDYFPELLNVSGDAGGKPVIKRHQSSVLELALSDPAILADVDTPEELQSYQQTMS